MKKQLVMVAAGLVTVLVLAGQLARAAAGPNSAEPQDSFPAWSSDGVHVAFERRGGGAAARVVVIAAGGRGAHVVSGGVLRSWVPRSNRLLIQVSGTQTLVTLDSTSDKGTLLNAVDATASPDGTRLAYLRDGTLYVSNIDGSGERGIATGITPPRTDIAGPAWSPDGTQIAIASGHLLDLVQTDGSGSRALIDGPFENDNPTWSRNGQLAFEHDRGTHWQIWVTQVGCINCLSSITGSADNRFPQFSPVSDTLLFISNRQHVRGAATMYQYALYAKEPPRTTPVKLADDVDPFGPATWSPTAALVAVSAFGECRRLGIDVLRSAIGSPVHRRSNLCRFDGTGSANVLHGTPYFDIVNGNGGDDTIYGNAGNDKLSGENGNDTIYGGAGNDFVLAGPGNDRVFGGAGNDTIIGGTGVDRIDCGPGDDTVEGADPLDRIARNCEHVRH